jgi:hypothetical protein
MHIPDLMWQLALAEERRCSSTPSSHAYVAALRDLELLARQIDEASDHMLAIVLPERASTRVPHAQLSRATA